jgi:N-carbamoyl-L-amino-acid hydrolase
LDCGTAAFAKPGRERHEMTACDIRAGSATARDLFARLAHDTAAAPGVTRTAYGEGERIAFALVAEAARGWSAEAAFDAAGNQFLTLPGVDRSRSIQIGSHLDSVPHGGNYDGAAGVVLGIALQAVLAGAGRQPPFDLTIACLRAEESCWFPFSYIGSKSALGLLDSAVLEGVRRSDTGRTLADHMREEGFAPERVATGERLIEPRRILAHIEPHIEQAPLLRSSDVPLGIVTGIRGSFRYRDIHCFGEYAHSGATPLGLRRDAVLASAKLVVALQAMWRDYEAGSEDLSVTFGEIGTDPEHHSFSKVAGEVRLCLDVRSQKRETLDRARAEMEAIVSRVAVETGTRFELGALSGSEPATMSASINGILADACAAAGVKARYMPSGAGHDAATFAQAGVPTTMLFIRSENGSHNPDEYMDMADFDRALAVLAESLEMPPQRWLDASAAPMSLI